MDKDHRDQGHHGRDHEHHEHRRKEGRQASRLALFMWGFLTAFLIAFLFIMIDTKFLNGVLTTQNREIQALEVSLAEANKGAQVQVIVSGRLAGLLGIENLEELVPYLLSKAVDDNEIRRLIKESNAARAKIRSLIQAGKLSKEEIGKLVKKARFSQKEAQDLLKKNNFSEAEIATLNQEIQDDQAKIADMVAKDQMSQDQIAGLRQKGEADQAEIAQQADDVHALQTQISGLKSRFNGAFEGILAAYPDVSRDGERFAFKHDIFFQNASAQLSAAGMKLLDEIAKQVQKVEGEAPKDIPWFIRVDGHTNHLGIHTERYPSNWTLSCARSIRVIEYLVKKGVPAHRLVAAGFSEYWPLKEPNEVDALDKNRRIELSFSHY